MLSHRPDRVPVGLFTRLAALSITSVITDKRTYVRVHSHRSRLALLTLGMACGLTARRDFERASETVRRKVRRATGLDKRISDNTIGTAANALECAEVTSLLSTFIKQELRRKTLPRVEGFKEHWVAVDGKSLGTVAATADNLAHPDVQPVNPTNGESYGLLRVHRAVLVTSPSTVVIHQRPIPGETNEIGAMPDLLDDLLQLYGRTSILGGIVADAGNTSQGVAAKIHAHDRGYLLRLKENSGEIYNTAVMKLGSRRIGKAQPIKRGAAQLYVWRAALKGGALGWESARQLIRIDRVVRRQDGTKSRGTRYFISNQLLNRMTPKRLVDLVRRYWRVENDGNWVSDAVFGEDRKMQPLSTQPEALYALSALRMLVASMLHILRNFAQTRRERAVGWDGLLRELYALLFAPEIRAGELPAMV